jgi:hypothetical protein
MVQHHFWISGFIPPLALGLTWSCAGVLGIEDAQCDVSYAVECARTGASTGLPPPGGSGGARGSGLGGSGLGGSVAAGAGGVAMGTGSDELLCARYCDLVAANCSGANQQYASPAACLAVCGLLDPGQPGDLSGNTVSCRLRQAELAASTGEPANYCFSAGPGGAGSCGTDCEGYCSVMSAQCEQLGPEEACLRACADVPDLSRPPQSIKYNTTQQSGNSLQCRLYHVSAASLDPVIHCVHAAGLAVCTAPP